VFCREEDVDREIACFIALLGEVYRELGFPDFEVALATRPLVRAGDDATWDWSEAKLGDAARQCGLVPQINSGEGAFYGPKLEFALRDRLGRSWQCGTVQLDGVLPQRLEASYVAPDGSRARPLMIHHAIFGSLGRMIAILLEHYGGVLPFWLSPDQVAVAPISKEQAGYGAAVLAAFEDAGIRAVAYDSTDTLSRRIVAAHENGGAGDGRRGGARDEGGPGEPARAQRLTGRRSASRGRVPAAGEGPAGRPCLKAL